LNFERKNAGMDKLIYEKFPTLYMGPARPSSSRNLMLMMGAIGRPPGFDGGETPPPPQSPVGVQRVRSSMENAGLRWGFKTGLGNCMVFYKRFNEES